MLNRFEMAKKENVTDLFFLRIRSSFITWRTERSYCRIYVARKRYLTNCGQLLLIMVNLNGMDTIWTLGDPFQSGLYRPNAVIIRMCTKMKLIPCIENESADCWGWFLYCSATRAVPCITQYQELRISSSVIPVCSRKGNEWLLFRACCTTFCRGVAIATDDRHTLWSHWGVKPTLLTEIFKKKNSVCYLALLVVR
jgi:hypothetical protein